MNAYRYFLFDLDGTLTDPGVGITNSVAHALEKHGIPVPPREALYPFIGPPLLQSFQKFYGMSESEAAQAVADYREYFRDRGIFENLLYPGIPELLAALRAAGGTCIVATSKPTVFARQILDHFAISQYFSDVVGSNLDGTLTEKGDVILEALRRSAVPRRSEAVMTGDRMHDMRGAEKAGIAAVGVLFGYGSREELETSGASQLAPSVEALQQILLGNPPRREERSAT